MNDFTGVWIILRAFEWFYGGLNNFTGVWRMFNFFWSTEAWWRRWWGCRRSSSDGTKDCHFHQRRSVEHRTLFTFCLIHCYGICCLLLQYGVLSVCWLGSVMLPLLDYTEIQESRLPEVSMVTGGMTWIRFSSWILKSERHDND